MVYEQSIKFEFPISNNQAEYEAFVGGILLAKEVGATRVELERVKRLSKEFDEVVVQHVPRERNTRADLLSKLASMKREAGNQSLIQGLLKELTVMLHLTQTADIPSWMDPVTVFLEKGKLPDNDKVTKSLRKEAAKYVIVQGQLFKRGLNQPLLKCLRPEQMNYVLTEVHEWCCGHHV
ncbi:uncharacterized protein [Arachis hypogaea]|uniref:uncharacterized protein n=1 Tax=Arachis hypogaea TaxID=3818 RepID=UPI003B2112D5